MKTTITLIVTTLDHFTEDEVRDAVDDMLQIGQADAGSTIDDLPNEPHDTSCEIAYSMEWELVKTHQPTPPSQE